MKTKQIKTTHVTYTFPRFYHKIASHSRTKLEAPPSKQYDCHFVIFYTQNGRIFSRFPDRPIWGSGPPSLQILQLFGWGYCSETSGYAKKWHTNANERYYGYRYKGGMTCNFKGVLLEIMIKSSRSHRYFLEASELSYQ